MFLSVSVTLTLRVISEPVVAINGTGTAGWRISVLAINHMFKQQWWFSPFISILITPVPKIVLTKNLKSVGMTLAKVKEQDGMTLAKVKEQDGMTVAK